jgi:hypothetical protein
LFDFISKSRLPPKPLPAKGEKTLIGLKSRLPRNGKFLTRGIASYLSAEDGTSPVAAGICMMVLVGVLLTAVAIALGG